ncbi:MAG: hypothetical protein HQL64_13770 [Magnetococcales bacterium]|nr:hypothetical protein [Magnetococcales bacterium]
MGGIHEGREDGVRSRAVRPPVLVGEGQPEEEGSLFDVAEALPVLSPLSLDTVLTVEDLRRLLKIVAYS